MIGSKRQQKFSRVILKEVGDIFQRNLGQFTKGNFVTVSDVRVTPDLREARIYFSMSLVENKDEVLETIRYHESEIRYHLGNRIRNQVKAVPELKFFLDEIPEKAERIENILKNLDIPPEEDEKNS